MDQSLKNTNRIVAISDHSVVLVKGADAVKFLQGQVTCDINALLSLSNRRPSALGAHCTHKGRMLFTFRAFCLDNTTIALVIHRELIPQAIQSLSKYIVFSKAELIDAQTDYQLLGIEGKAGKAVLEEYIPNLSDQVDTVSLTDGLAAICLGNKRYEVLFNHNSDNDSSHTASCKDSLYAVCKPADGDHWTLGNIESGIGEVRPETIEEFIPQMLNLHAVGNGISFNKGCYTGQEIVARMQYRRKLKRQMYRLRSKTDKLFKPGDSIYSPSEDKPIGTVVIASCIKGYADILAVVLNKVIVEKDPIYLDKHHQHELKLLTIPYTITQET